jgi:3-oxoacyl-(acyl-carrier-protein) synthase
MPEHGPPLTGIEPRSTSPGIPGGVSPQENSRPLVTIAGCGAICAMGSGTDALRNAVRTNASGLKLCDRFNNPRFQSGIAGTAPRPEGDNPAFYLANIALTEARDAARQPLSELSPDRIALVLATTKANIEALERLSDARPCSASARRHLQGEFLAADLAAEHGARGPVACVSNACVSGLVALQQGAKLIQRGSADAALVIGVDHLSAFVMAGFTALKALDPAGCRPFDKDRSGLSPGEAGAAVVLINQALTNSPRMEFKLQLVPENKLKLELHALHHSTAPPPRSPVLRGWATSNDANHMTGPSRDGSGLAAAISQAIKNAGLEPCDIDYINAHGTGTPYNDAMESAAFTTVFGSACPPVSGSKGVFGHTLGAAGVLEAILCVLAMQEQLLPGTPRLSHPAEATPSSLLLQPRPGRLKHVLKVNTGFGGINGAIVLSYGQ